MKEIESERQLFNDSRKEQRNASHKDETQRKQALYVTVDNTEASVNVTGTTNVSNRGTNGVLNKVKVENSRDIMDTLDKEIGEMDQWLSRLKEEKYRLQQKQAYGNDNILKTQKKEEWVDRNVHSQLESADVDKKEMEREIKEDMRSTPKYLEERETYRRNNYDELIARYDACTLDPNVEERYMVNKEQEDRAGHVGFVKEEEKSDVKRFYVDRDYTQNRHRINEQEIGLSLGGERLIVRHGDRDDHLWGLTICLWLGPPWFNYWFSFTLAYSRISHEYSSLFIIVINLIFVFSL